MKVKDPRKLRSLQERAAYIMTNAELLVVYKGWATDRFGHVKPPYVLNAAEMGAFWAENVLCKPGGNVEGDHGEGDKRGEKAHPDKDAKGKGKGDQGDADGGGDAGENGREGGDGKGEPKGEGDEGDQGEGEAEAEADGDKGDGKTTEEILKDLLAEDPDKLPEPGDDKGEGEAPPEEEKPPKKHEPSWMDLLRKMAKVRTAKGLPAPIMLIGPTGCGKTHMVEVLAEEMGLPFYAVSCNEELSPETIQGYPLPDVTKGEEKFMPGPLVKAITEGGIFLADEADALNPNAALAFQTALSNGWISIPGFRGGELQKVSPQFYPIATANTFGTGADRQYVGRNAQDAAFLDRFKCLRIEIDYDEKLEKKIACKEAAKFGQRVRKLCRKDDRGGERVGFTQDVSTRAIVMWSSMMKAGFTLEEAVYPFFLEWTDDELNKVRLKRCKKLMRVEAK